MSQILSMLPTSGEGEGEGEGEEGVVLADICLFLFCLVLFVLFVFFKGFFQCFLQNFSASFSAQNLREICPIINPQVSK